jgi:hypothetical protein
MNSVKSDSIKILTNLYWVAANLSGGCAPHADVMSQSNLCKQIFHFIKFKKDKKLVREMTYFLYNLVKMGGPISIITLIKLKIIWLSCEILTNFYDEDIITTILKLLDLLLDRTDSRFFIIEELKEFNAISKLENLILSPSDSGTYAEILLSNIKSQRMDDN